MFYFLRSGMGGKLSEYTLFCDVSMIKKPSTLLQRWDSSQIFRCEGETWEIDTTVAKMQRGFKWIKWCTVIH